MRAQVSIFIVVGLFLLIGFGLFFAFMQIELEDDARTSVISGTALKFIPPQNYIDYCVEEHVAYLLQNISFTQTRMIYQNESYEFVHTRAGAHEPLTFAFVESYLDEHLPQAIRNCVDSGVYADLGYEVSRGPVSTQTTLTPERINVALDFPFSISNGEQEFELTDHNSQITLAYGRLLLFIADAVNAELEESWFDQVAYMHRPENEFQNQPLISISKYKPYPHTLYSFVLNQTGIVFEINLAIEGEDVYFEDQIVLETQFAIGKSETVCVINDVCYADVKENTCEIVDGDFATNRVCGQSDFSQIEFTDCNGIPSGTSWCEFDPGVGGRFFRSACVDGVIETESCRDFRQELCVEQGSTAKCRANTGLSCGDCSDGSCCTGDCKWLDNSCVPAASLGHKFWEATNYCENTIVDSSVCPLVGDCGQSLNYYGDSELSGLEAITLQNTLADRGILNWDEELDLAQPTVNQQQSVSSRLADVLDELEEHVELNYAQYVDPNVTDIVNITGSSFCSEFIPPSNVCDYCGQDRPCTEYACKSLGLQCSYDPLSANCFEQEPTKRVNVVSINTQRSSNTVEGITRFMFGSVSTVKPINLSIETDIPALCRATYLPTVSYSQIAIPDMSDGEFSTNHTFVLRFVNDLPVIDRVAPFFAKESLSEITQDLIDFRYTLDKLRLKYPNVKRFTPSFLPFLSHFVETASEYEDMTNVLLSDLEDKRVSIFISCISSEGVQHTPAFVSFDLKQSCQDEFEAYVMYDAEPFTISEFEVHTNVLADCSYQSQGEVVQLECPESISDIGELDYVCRGDKPNSSQVDITCVERKSYEDVFVHVNSGNGSNVTVFPVAEQIQSTGAIILDTADHECRLDAGVGGSCENCQFFNTSADLVCEKSTGCDRQKTIQARFYELEPLEVLDIQLRNNSIIIETQESSEIDRGVQCSILSGSTRSVTLDRVNFRHVGSVSHIPVGEFVRITCVDIYGSTASTSVLKE